MERIADNLKKRFRTVVWGFLSVFFRPFWGRPISQSRDCYQNKNLGGHLGYSLLFVMLEGREGWLDGRGFFSLPSVVLSRKVVIKALREEQLGFALCNSTACKTRLFSK